MNRRVDIEREWFSNMFDSILSPYTEDILELINCNEGLIGIEFYLLNSDSQIFIISEYTTEMISWYKTYHVGRCLVTNMKEDEIFNFLNRLKAEYKANYVEEKE